MRRPAADAVAEPAPSLHRLAAHNIVVGETDFLSLPLPPPWRVTRAVVTPEVRTTVRDASRIWVASGETRHVVFDRTRNLGCELVVRISHAAPRLPQRARRVLEEGRTVCNGHEAPYRLIERRRGFLLRGLEQALLLGFTCQNTRRGIVVEIAGQCTAEDLRGFLRVMAGLVCHSS